MKGLNSNAKAQAMILLKMACNAGATAAALTTIHACSASRAGENAVDWGAAETQLQTLVATLPGTEHSQDDLGLDLVEEDDDGELAA